MSVVFSAVGVIGSLLSWPLSSRVGRRRMYNGGLGFIAVLMFIVGILDCVPNYENRSGVIWGQSALLVCSILLFLLLFLCHLSCHYTVHFVFYLLFSSSDFSFSNPSIVPPTTNL
jgi:zinc transporter ZupT